MYFRNRKKEGKKHSSSKFTKSFALLFLLLFLTLSLQAKESSPEELKPLSKEELKVLSKEGKALGKKGNKKAVSFLKRLGKSSKPLKDLQNTFVSEEEANKTFDGKKAKEQFLSGKVPISDLENNILETQSLPKLDSAEEFLQRPKALLASPEKGGVIEVKTPVSEEQKLETCHEGGTFVRAFTQTREVKIIPEKIQEEKICLGHTDDVKGWKKSTRLKNLKKFVKKKEKREGKIYYYYIDPQNQLVSGARFLWWHKNPDLACTHFDIQKTVLEKEKQEDVWVSSPNDQRELKDLEKDPECSLMHTRHFAPGRKTLKNRSVFRDSWERKLIFSCSPKKDSKCKRLRDLGGILVSKKCLKEAENGECLSWQKTFDLGRKASFEKIDMNLSGEELLLPEMFDPSYEKNREFGKVMSTYASFSDIKGEQTHITPQNAKLFSGCAKKCRRSFDSKNLFDCCYKKGKEGRGVFIDSGLGSCTHAEKELYYANKEGKCKKVGLITHLLQTKHIYCCFASKLSRIVQEEARKQLGLSFGTAEKPDCRPLTVAEIERIDFEKIDFSEFESDLQEKITAKDLKNRFRKAALDFAEKQAPFLGKENTEAILEREKEISKQNRRTK